MFPLSYTFSAFCLLKVSTLTSKQLPAKPCTNVIVLLCTVETECTKPDENLCLFKVDLRYYATFNF